MITQFSFGQMKGTGGDEQTWDEGTAGGLLAVTAMTFEHHDGFRGAFVSYGTATAASRKICGHKVLTGAIALRGLKRANGDRAEKDLPRALHQK
jgi:hypothetical protein